MYFFLCVVTFKQEAETYVLKGDESPHIFGPIVKQTWICVTQLLKRLSFGEWSNLC
jgi:hypothetical protein